MSRIYTGDYDRTIAFRCSDALYDLIKQGAVASGLDTSTYIRAALWTAVPRVLALQIPSMVSGTCSDTLPAECCARCRWCGSPAGASCIYCTDQQRMKKPEQCCDSFEKRCEK